MLNKRTIAEIWKLVKSTLAEIWPFERKSHRSLLGDIWPSNHGNNINVGFKGVYFSWTCFPDDLTVLMICFILSFSAIMLPLAE